MDNLRKEPIRVPFAACKDDEKPYVFASYAHADRERVFPIFKAVYEAGVDVWYDQGIEINAQYDEVIATHVAECELFVLFISTAAMASDYVVKKELGFASRSGKQIIPVYVEPTELPHGVNMLLEGAAAAPTEELPRVLTELLSQRCGGWQPKVGRAAKGLTVNAAAEPVAMEEYEYKTTKDGIVLTKYLGNDTDVVIPAEHNGLPVVGLEGTFFRSKGVVSVQISNSVTSIGVGAFIECTALASITIPDSVMSIGEAAFIGCTTLTSITVPGSVTSIGEGAFDGCIALKSIVIPNSVTSIGFLAFNGCESLTISCELGSYAEEFAKREEIRYETVNIEHKQEPSNKTRQRNGEFGTAGCMKSICVYCHSTDTARSKTIVDTIKKQCGKVKRIDENVSAREMASTLADSGVLLLLISQQAVKDEALSLIPAAEGHYIPVRLEDITLPDKWRFQIESEQMLVFDGKTAQEDSLAKLCSVLADRGCLPKRSLIIPDFEYTQDERGIILAKYTGKDTSVVIDKEYFGKPVVEIGFSAFENRTALTGITIPNSVTSIELWAFKDCTKLKSITIPDGVTSIGDWAFEGCTALKSIVIPDSVTSIGSGSFVKCASLTSIYVRSENRAYCSIEGVLFSVDATELIRYPCSNKINDYRIPDGVTSIGDWAFEGCTVLKNIVIPDSVTSIGRWAFEGCTALKSIVIPDSVTSIGSGSFDKCASLTSIYVRSENRAYCSIEGVLFSVDATELIRYPCANKINDYRIPDGVTSIGRWAFYGCTSLQSITISDSVTSICEDAFENSPPLTIYATPGSYAEQYAYKKNIKFCAVEATVPEEATVFKPTQNESPTAQSAPAEEQKPVATHKPSRAERKAQMQADRLAKKAAKAEAKAAKKAARKAK